MSESYIGDFIGMEYNGVHSSALGFVRTSNGDRYNLSLLPSFEDQTAQVQGRDETYYFGLNYTDKNISIDIAFDEINESRFRKITKLFSDRKPHKLILDESPYKYYNVKIAESPEIDYLCFDNGGERIYKGEGSLSFVAYNPFAQSTYKYLTDYNSDTMKYWDFKVTKDVAPILNNKIYYTRDSWDNYTPIIFTDEIEFPQKYTQCDASKEFNSSFVYYIFDGTKYTEVENLELETYRLNPSNYYTKNNDFYYEGGNINEWFFSLDLLPNQTYQSYTYDTFISGENKINLYNPGDLETDFEVTIPFTEDSISNLKFYLSSFNTTLVNYQLLFNDNILKKGNDAAIKINSINNLVYGVDSVENGKPTGNIYNEYITGGHFFKIPVTYRGEENYSVVSLQLGSISNAYIKYNYKFYN